MIQMLANLHSCKVEVEPFAASLGALVRCDDVQDLDNQAFSAVYRAYLDNLVLLIRNQRLDEGELLAFARRFGELALADPLADRKPYKYPEIAVVSNIVENGVAIGRLGDGEATWHTDGSYLDKPPTASVLYSVEIPPSGGNTGFANMYLALESLPAALLEKIRGRTIRHHQIYTGFGHLRRGHSADEDPRNSPGPDHPIMWKHPETGHNALFLGRPKAHINGLSLEESETVLDALWKHSGKPEFSWHHEWRVGDILIWDNRCVIHRRDAFAPTTRRLMWRTMCTGTHVPAGPTGVATTVHPRGRLQ